MSYAAEMRRAWTEKFGHANILLLETCLEEELQELQDSLSCKSNPPQSPEELLKEMCDVIVTLYGLAEGIGFNLDRALREVMESNMTKGPERRGDGKVLKGDGYQPPDLTQCV